MLVLKASGKKEEFKPDKILGTLLRAGASKKTANEIVNDIKGKVRDGTTTKEILDMAPNDARSQRDRFPFANLRCLP